MSQKKRKSDAKRRQKKRAKELGRRRAQQPSASIVDAREVEIDIFREIRYIMELAQAGDARLVMLRDFVLFSTETNDAWLLDSEDSLALCLMRDGKVQPYRIVDTPTTFAIEWNAKFDISGETFVVIERSGKVTSILEYPTVPIANACAGRMP